MSTFSSVILFSVFIHFVSFIEDFSDREPIKQKLNWFTLSIYRKEVPISAYAGSFSPMNVSRRKQSARSKNKNEWKKEKKSWMERIHRKKKRFLILI